MKPGSLPCLHESYEEDDKWERGRSFSDTFKWKGAKKILKEFRHGVFSSMSPSKKESKETAKFYTSVDSGHTMRFGQHWYDDPPYESDPDEMALCPAKTSLSMPYVETGSKYPNGSCIQDRDEPPPSSWVYSGDSVIMTRTAGDIQVSRDQIRSKDPSSLSPNHQPQKQRLSGGGGSGGGQRISNCSVETTGSSKRDSMDSPKEDTGPSSPILGKKNKMFSKIKNITGRTNANPAPVSASEEALSLSSDYEDQDDAERKMERRLSRDVTGRASTFVGRVKGFGNDVKKKISKLRPSRTVSESEASDPNANIEATIGTSASSVESIPSGSGSSVQALTTSSSNRSSTSVEEEVPPYTGPFIGKARAIVDYTPSPYDKDALKFKKGDVIDIISMSQTGSWTGMVNNRVGHFKFINVEPLPEAKPPKRRSRLPRRVSKRGKPKSVEELLQRINLEEHISVFVLNGYEHLDLFKELEEEDLDYLGISDPEHRAKILTAVELLHDYDSPDSPDADDEPITDGESFPDQSDASKVSGDSVLIPKNSHSPRDSGCYASNENLPNRESLQRGNTPAGSGDISQSESGIHSSDGMDSLTPAAANNLDRREVSALTCLTQQTLANGGPNDGDAMSHVTTRAVIEVVPKQHGYLPNILPAAGLVYVEGGQQVAQIESCNEGLVNGCISNEDSDSSSNTPAWFKASVDNSLRNNDSKCGGGVVGGTAGERNCSTYEYRTLGPSRFTTENDDATVPSSSPARCSSPPLRRDVASLAHAFRSQSLDRPSSPLLGGGGTFSPGTLRGRSLAGLRPTQLAQQSIPPTSTAAVPAGDGSSPSKSVTMPRKPGAPSKIKIPHLPAPLGNRKVIAFKEPSASPTKGKLKSTRTPRPVSVTLDAMLQRKLQDEMIDLAQEPYTDKSGFCAIPPALVQRYSDEVKRDVKEVADALDQIRIACLQQRGRQGVPNDFLADSCMSSVQDQANYESLEAWLASIGLPMYADTLRCSGHGQLNDLCQLGEVDLRASGVNNPLHLRRIMTEIEALNIHLQKFAC